MWEEAVGIRMKKLIYKTKKRSEAKAMAFGITTKGISCNHYKRGTVLPPKNKG